jgi:hypothetical protein
LAFKAATSSPTSSSVDRAPSTRPARLRVGARRRRTREDRTDHERTEQHEGDRRSEGLHACLRQFVSKLTQQRWPLMTANGSPDGQHGLDRREPVGVPSNAPGYGAESKNGSPPRNRRPSRR